MSEYVQYVLSGLSLGCIYALVALGIVLIVNVTGVYNFALGNYVMFGGTDHGRHRRDRLERAALASSSRSPPSPASP